MTSHAAVVARGMGRCCVAGCGDIRVNEDKGISSQAVKIRRRPYISIDGSTGSVYEGNRNKRSTAYRRFSKFMSWADEVRTLNIRTNADTPRDAKTAVNFGAEGIGLAERSICSLKRTESRSA